MAYKLDKGWQWNFDNLYSENQKRQSEIYAESVTRLTESTQAREELEQSLTDSYLNHVETEQNITELTLKVIELEGRL